MSETAWARPAAAVAEGVADRGEKADRRQVIEQGSPQFAAWVAHWRNIGRHELARSAELLRQVEVDAAWPPESPEVTEIGGAFHVPHGTPEWASHVASARRADARRGQAMALAQQDIPAARTRWGKG